MNPKDFYMSETAGIEELDLTPATFVGLDALPLKSLIMMPQGNTIAFRAPWGAFTAARARHHQGCVEIASLFFSVRLPAPYLDFENPVGLIALPEKGGFFQREMKIAYNWVGMDNHSSMKAEKIKQGVYEPLCWSSSFHGVDAKASRLDHYVLLPEAPTGVRESASGVEVASGGQSFIIKDEAIAKAALSGEAHWVLPDASGNFVWPA